MLCNKHTRFHEVLTEFGMVTIDSKGVVKGTKAKLTKEQEKKIGKFSGFKYVEDKPKVEKPKEQAQDKVKPIKVKKIIEDTASEKVKTTPTAKKPATKRRGRPSASTDKK